MATPSLKKRKYSSKPPPRIKTNQVPGSLAQTKMGAHDNRTPTLELKF